MSDMTEKDLKEIATSLESELLHGDGSMDIFEVVDKVWKKLILQNQLKKFASIAR